VRKTIFIILVLVHFAGCAAAPRGPELLDSGVRFTLSAPGAESVAITGTFNRWDPRGQELSGPDSSGVWSITLPLGPGRYEYAFIVNNTEWTTDPGMPFVDDGFGGKNSVIEVEK
jgi:1,4-alpha-glucan branching enzyme